MPSVGKIVNGEYQEFADDTDAVILTEKAIAETPITFQQAVERANVESGDSISVALGKLSKLYEDLETNLFAGLKKPVQEQFDEMMVTLPEVTGVTWTDENLKTALHERMTNLSKSLLSTRSEREFQIGWTMLWTAETWMFGQVSIYDRAGYQFTCYTHNRAYFGYGGIYDADIGYFNRMYPPQQTSDAYHLKTWGLGDWIAKGGNVPDGVEYGTVLRVYGYDEPGVASTNDTMFLLIAFASGLSSRLFTAYTSQRGVTTVPWIEKT